jgi:hypothetical protein
MVLAEAVVHRWDAVAGAVAVVGIAIMILANVVPSPSPAVGYDVELYRGVPVSPAQATMSSARSTPRRLAQRCALPPAPTHWRHRSRLSTGNGS